MQFADSASNIAAGPLIQTTTLSFCIFKNFLLFFREILKGKGLFHVTSTCKRLCYIIRRFLCPLLFSSNRYQIPFCRLATAYKIEKSTKIKRVPYCIEYLLAAWKGSLIAFTNIAKDYQIPIEQIACGHLKNECEFKNSVYHLRFSYSWKHIRQYIRYCYKT